MKASRVQTVVSLRHEGCGEVKISACLSGQFHSYCNNHCSAIIIIIIIIMIAEKAASFYIILPVLIGITIIIIIGYK